VIVADAGLHARALKPVPPRSRRASIATADGALLRRHAVGLLRAGGGARRSAADRRLPAAARRPFRLGATAHFDAAFVLISLGSLLLLPLANLPSALYRARGDYGRMVWLQSGGMLASQLVAARGDRPERRPARRQHRLCIGPAAVGDLSYRGRCAQVVSVPAPRWAPPPFLRWSLGQFRRAFPFGVAGATELALVNAPVLLVSAFVSERMAVAQWGLTRVIAGLVRTLCVQATLPLAAELGHDHAIGDKARLRDLYARGSVLVTLLASVTVAALLPFWPDFFALWTHGSVAYDPLLVITLLIGSSAVAPSILALSFAYYSGRGELLVRTKGLQLVVFLGLSLSLIPTMGPLGAAIAIVASDLLVQFGLLTLGIVGGVLRHPRRHIALLAVISVLVVVSGWGMGAVIRWHVPGSGAVHFVIECATLVDRGRPGRQPARHQALPRRSHCRHSALIARVSRYRFPC